MNGWVPHRSPQVLEKVVDGETILVHCETNQLIALSESAAAIWRLIDGQRPVGAILERIADEYGPTVEPPPEEHGPDATVLVAEGDTVTEQAESLIQLLLQSGLLVSNKAT